MNSSKRYTQEEKEKILAYAQENSISAAHRKFGVSDSTIKTWRKDRPIPYVPTEMVQVQELERTPINTKALDRFHRLGNIDWDTVLRNAAIKAVEEALS